MWGALSEERTSLSFTIAAGPCHRSHSRVQVPWDSRPYFTVSDRDFPFRRLIRLAGLLSAENTVLLLRDANHTENTSHVIATRLVHWRADCCLAMSCNIRPLKHSFHCCACLRSRFLAMLWSNPLQHNERNTKLTVIQSLLLTRNTVRIYKYLQETTNLSLTLKRSLDTLIRSLLPKDLIRACMHGSHSMACMNGHREKYWSGCSKLSILLYIYK
jgi:hypothetical protein